MKNKRFLLKAIIGVILLPCWLKASAQNSESLQYARNLSLVFEFVKKNYVDDVEAKKLYEGALKGLLEAFEDPHTTYLDKDLKRQLSDTTQGSFGGVGLVISKPFKASEANSEYVLVSAPLEDTPGAKAGILSGDYITHIDGKSTLDMKMDEVLDTLRGKVGSKVKLSIKRGENITFDVTLVRALIEVPVVKWDIIDSTGYLKLIEFTPDTAVKVREALTEFKKKGVKSLVLDLRNNPGGLISSVVEIVDFFLDDGVIVSTKGRDGVLVNEFRASSKNTIIRDMPIAVLINKGSASSSEILSGALKDHHLAILVGETSYGKGSVQQIVPLDASGDEQIKLTVARYYTPSDANIDKIGIPPDVKIAYPELSKAEEDAYTALIKDEKIENYVKKYPKMSEKEVASFASSLKSSYPLPEVLLRRMIHIELWRAHEQPVYDLDFDIQLKKALEVVKDKKFASKVKKTETVFDLQHKNAEKK